MKRSPLLPFLLLCCSGYSQEKLSPFGKPDKAELEMKECSFDHNANAVRLVDFEEKEVMTDYGLKIKSKRRVKIKIFNEKGFGSADIIIPYVSRVKGTKITDISAYIYYFDGTGNIITEKVSKKQIFRDKEDADVKSVKFTFPHVKPGCVIEYRYEKTEKNSFSLDPWYFQTIIPTLYSRFTLIMPSSIIIDEKTVGMDSIDRFQGFTQSGGSVFSPYERTYILRNVPAFKAEPMMSSVADNLQRIEFAVQPSGFGYAGTSFRRSRWEILARVLNEVPLFGQQFNKPIPGTEGVLDSARAISDREGRISFIFQRVKQQVKWDEQQTFYAGDIAAAWKEHSGNSADINLIVLNLLRKSGINCSPILISTRMNGQIDQNFFSLGQFNGVDVLILDTSANYVLDGTRKYQSYRTPPDNIMNRNVLNVDTARIGWLFISDSRPLLKSTLTVEATLSAESKVTGTALLVSFDHSKVQRMMELETSEEEKEDEKEFLQKDFADLRVDSFSRENADNDLEPLSEKFNFTYQPSVSDKFIFFDPFFLSRFRKNPFTDSARNSGLDFTSRQYLKTSVHMTLPDGYDVDHVPKNLRLRMADSSILFERRIYHEGNQMLFVNTMEILSPLFSKEEYSGVREFFNHLYTLVTEQIILRRKD